MSNLLYLHFGEYPIKENYRPEWMSYDGNGRLELDFFIEELRIAVEVQGEQHNSFVEFFHRNENGFNEQKRRDSLKESICSNSGIILFKIYDEQDALNCIESIYKITGVYKSNYQSFPKIQNSVKLELEGLTHAIEQQITTDILSAYSSYQSINQVIDRFSAICIDCLSDDYKRRIISNMKKAHDIFKDRKLVVVKVGGGTGGKYGMTIDRDGNLYVLCQSGWVRAKLKKEKRAETINFKCTGLGHGWRTIQKQDYEIIPRG